MLNKYEKKALLTGKALFLDYYKEIKELIDKKAVESENEKEAFAHMFMALCTAIGELCNSFNKDITPELALQYIEDFKSLFSSELKAAPVPTVKPSNPLMYVSNNNDSKPN